MSSPGNLLRHLIHERFQHLFQPRHSPIFRTNSQERNLYYKDGDLQKFSLFGSLLKLDHRKDQFERCDKRKQYGNLLINGGD